MCMYMEPSLGRQRPQPRAAPTALTARATLRASKLARPPLDSALAAAASPARLASETAASALPASLPCPLSQLAMPSRLHAQPWTAPKPWPPAKLNPLASQRAQLACPALQPPVFPPLAVYYG